MVPIDGGSDWLMAESAVQGMALEALEPSTHEERLMTDLVREWGDDVTKEDREMIRPTVHHLRTGTSA